MDSNYYEEDSEKQEIGPSKTLQILMLFAHKFLYPTLYPDYNITFGQFETLLDLLEEKITQEMKKVEKEVNIKDNNMNEEMSSQVEEQMECLIESGELFLDSIEEMRMYLELENEEKNTDKARDYLLKGIEIARRADKQLRKSLEIFEELRESN